MCDEQVIKLELISALARLVPLRNPMCLCNCLLTCCLKWPLASRMMALQWTHSGPASQQLSLAWWARWSGAIQGGQHWLWKWTSGTHREEIISEALLGTNTRSLSFYVGKHIPCSELLQRKALACKGKRAAGVTDFIFGRLSLNKSRFPLQISKQLVTGALSLKLWCGRT